ncbi:hypothetical protein [Fortiea contorta]|uniref:hypothetical protein n=1 Tax=Fortiea contorta TaxID=1892405 RepID=UPI00034B0E72|nr:hypothetical protein [Fortiea contorta]
MQHRYEWLYLYGYVQPQTAETEWHILPRVNIDWFNLSLAEFAKSIGAGKEKIVVLVIERAGWHMSEKVVIPEGIY